MKKFLPLWISWCISLAGCILSIYFREILHKEPCPLCWYQRMALFPLAILLGMGLFRGDRKVIAYALPFAFFGLIVAVYQVIGAFVPSIFHTGLCGETTHCSSGVFALFGFLTFPMLSGIGFFLIALLLLLSRK
jgi:disulfide bond formation protein DsbB